MHENVVTPFSRLLRNTLLTLFLAGTAALLAYGFYSWQREESEVKISMGILSGFLASASQSFFDELGNGLAPLGELLGEINVLKNPEAARPHLENFAKRHPQVVAVAIFAPDGTMRINTAVTPGKELPNFHKDPPYLTQLLKDMNNPAHYSLGPPEFGKAISRWRFTVRHVVRSKSGKPVFMLQVAIPLEKEGTFLHQLPVPENSYVGLLRADGYQQARYPVEDVSATYGQLSPGPAARMIKETPGILVGSFSGASPWVVGEAHRVGAFTRLPNLAMYAYVSVPASYVTQRWWQGNLPILTSFLIFFFIFVLIAYRVTKHESLHSRELIEQASRDALTGLPNRASLQNILNANISMAYSGNRKFSILFLDLDRFKGINDTFGHAVGDKLLVKVAQVIHPLLRGGDVLGRFGGDEFLLVLPGSDESGVILITQRILDAFNVPFEIDGISLRITPSIGIAIYPAHGTEIETLLKHADTAMYESKRVGRNAYTFYAEQMGSRVSDRLALEHQLHDALQMESFCLVYQPIVTMGSGEIVAVEALLRWEIPNGKWRLPGEFIFVAEDSGMIIPLGEWVIRSACKQIKQWTDAGFELSMAVNISARQFQDPLLLEKVMTILGETGVEPSRLELEVTESSAMLNPEKSVEILRAFSEHGVRIAIDDFGTGYSSLSYLKKFPADTIKIDRTFVEELGYKADDATIVKSVVALANALEKYTVAEGIETAEQFIAIRNMGCDFGQGFWISVPLEVDSLTKLLQQGKKIVDLPGNK
jgi:diguanylate cyclase (GGDEF)-like protein